MLVDLGPIHIFHVTSPSWFSSSHLSHFAFSCHLPSSHGQIQPPNSMHFPLCRLCRTRGSSSTGSATTLHDILFPCLSCVSTAQLTLLLSLTLGCLSIWAAMAVGKIIMLGYSPALCIASCKGVWFLPPDPQSWRKVRDNSAQSERPSPRGELCSALRADRSLSQLSRLWRGCQD